jgi:uncharacterized protein YaiI (UPF0178 family)
MIKLFKKIEFDSIFDDSDTWILQKIKFRKSIFVHDYLLASHIFINIKVFVFYEEREIYENTFK